MKKMKKIDFRNFKVINLMNEYYVNTLNGKYLEKFKFNNTTLYILCMNEKYYKVEKSTLDKIELNFSERKKMNRLINND